MLPKQLYNHCIVIPSDDRDSHFTDLITEWLRQTSSHLSYAMLGMIIFPTNFIKSGPSPFPIFSRLDAKLFLMPSLSSPPHICLI